MNPENIVEAVETAVKQEWGGEIRCFFRDPDDHLIEVSELLDEGPDTSRSSSG